MTGHTATSSRESDRDRPRLFTLQAAADTDGPTPNGHRASERLADAPVVPAARPTDEIRAT
jgi:hypothetical protein